MTDLTTDLRNASLSMLASAAASSRKANDLHRSAEQARRENRHALEVAEMERAADAESESAAIWQRRAEGASAGYFPATEDDLRDPLYLQRFQDLPRRALTQGRALSNVAAHLMPACE
jgi:hypothetical protein